MKNKILQGECIEVMKKCIEDNSIDTIITDPPYHLTSIVKRFGKNSSAPAKFGTNGVFQRSSKGFMGKKWDGGDIAFKTKVWKECLRVIKPGGTALIFGSPRTYHRMACAVENAGWIIKDCIMWLYGSGFPKAHDISKAVDAKIKTGKSNPGAMREVEQKHGGKRYTLKGRNNGILGEKKEWSRKEYKPDNEWNGWKSHGLKPAYEPILVCMKPNEGSYAQNALKHGVSGLNINGGRIGIEEVSTHNAPKGTFAGGEHDRGSDTESYKTHKGRFPANIILNEKAAKMLDEQSGIRCGQLAPTTGKEPSSFKQGKVYGDYSGYGKTSQPIDKLGGASRFFYCAKSSKAEKDLGCEKLKEGCNHPTVKPLRLLEYLCILTKTPTGGIILDPFAGSGSTLIAAKKIGRNFIGIEKEKEYCEIIKAKLKITQIPLF